MTSWARAGRLSSASTARLGGSRAIDVCHRKGIGDGLREGLARNCYAESFSRRVGQEVWGTDAPRRFFGDKHWNEPLKWNRDALKEFGRPARVFCASMADVFEESSGFT